MATKKYVQKLKKLPGKKVKKAAPVRRAEDGSRLRKLSRKQQRKRNAQLLKKEQQKKHLPSAWRIFIQSLKQLYMYKWTFLGILFFYAFFYILFIKGVGSNFQLGNLRKNLVASFDGKLNKLDSGLALYGLLLGTAGTNGTESSGVYQTILLVITSLALIWALRTSYAQKAKVRVSIKDSFYKSTSSLVPFLILAFIIVVQCLPAVFVGTIFSTIQTSHLAVNAFQEGIAIAILVAGLLWTFYMLSTSLFALYIVTLPNAKPWASLKAAKRLVKYRRLLVLRKVIFLPVSLLVIAGLLLIPLIIFFAKGAEVLFLILTIVVIAVVHGYLYTLYRYLIDDTHYEQD